MVGLMTEDAAFMLIGVHVQEAGSAIDDIHSDKNFAGPINIIRISYGITFR
jgi:hypothetical protein